MERLKRIIEAKKVLSDLWDVAAFVAHHEITSAFDDLTDEELSHLIDVVVAVYQDNDYATPTGVACALCELLGWGEDVDVDYLAVTAKDLFDAWEGGDRT